MFGKVIKVVKQAKAKTVSRDCNVPQVIKHTTNRKRKPGSGQKSCSVSERLSLTTQINVLTVQR